MCVCVCDAQSWNQIQSARSHPYRILHPACPYPDPYGDGVSDATRDMTDSFSYCSCRALVCVGGGTT